MSRVVNKDHVRLCLDYIKSSKDYTFEIMLKEHKLWNRVDTTGGEVKLACPFHDDDEPSFFINEEKKVAHCFSCGRGGNYLKMLTHIHKEVLGSNQGFYAILQSLLDGDPMMKVTTQISTIFVDKKFTMDELKNFKRTTFVRTPGPVLEDLADLSYVMKKEKINTLENIKLAGIYAQDGYSARDIYSVLKESATVVGLEDYSGLDINAIFETIGFDWEE